MPKSGPKSGELVEQPHGGAILNGSKPGHPATGRPPSAIRGSLREVMDQSVELLRELVEYKPDELPDHIKMRDVLRAIDIAGKYGLGEKSRGYDEDLVDELSQAVGEAVADRDDGDAVLDDVRRRWVAILAGRVRGS